MIKKIAAATALLTLSSFASWDRFPVQAEGKGEAKLGIADVFSTGDENGYDIFIGAQARYTVMTGLEVAGFVPARLGKDDPTGVAKPILGVRYWMPSNIGAFLDIGLPFGNEDLTLHNFTFTPGLQYAMDVNSQVAIAAEASYTINTEKDDYTPSNELWLGAEVDFNMGGIVPWVGLDFVMLGDAEQSGETLTPEDDTGVYLSAGSTFEISETLGTDASLQYGLSGVEEKSISLEANVSVKF